MTRHLLSFLVLLSTIWSCKNAPDEPRLFETLDSATTGVGFVNRLTDTPQLNIIDYLYFYNGAGVSAGDINNDGLTDLYFVSNQGPNKLYLNRTKKGESPHFDDITIKANAAGTADWQTGTTMVDVNGDGLLDIYVCAVSGFKGGTAVATKGRNELYINKGPGPDGIPTFTEQAEAYGLAFAGFSTQAAFFDYDHDGDLDCFLLNHAVHSVRSFDKVTARDQPDSLAGDFLFENNGVGKPFQDVSAKAGIFQAPMGYGLGVAVADMNNDGWEDIYVSNDFHEDDYLYLNTQRGGFTNVAPQRLAHTSRFSMGSDAADINHDGFADLVTLDMYPEDETVEKSSAGEDPLDIYTYKLAYGYMNQYSRNCLQLNQSGQRFAEIGALSGIAATDWSWSPLLADYDLDGQTDLFIANGILRRPNDLDYIKYVSSDSAQMALGSNPTGTSAEALKKVIGSMPEGRVHNYLYRGRPDLQFQDKSLTWGFDKPNCASGAAYADLDNDGDLDLITNNLNEPAGIHLNQANILFPTHTYLSVRLQGSGANSAGVGAKVMLRYGNDSLQLQQLMPTRGFQSSVEPRLTFGLGIRKTIDSLIVIWPNQQMEVRTNVPVNQQLVVKQTDATLDGRGYVIAGSGGRRASRLFTEEADSTLVPYRHQENSRYLDFSRESLMPFKVSTEGPRLAVGDINGDGLDDVYAGGARDQPGSLLLQTSSGRFVVSSQPAIAVDSVAEDVDALFFDADGDRDLDLYVVSGGNEYSKADPVLQDRLYLNTNGQFSRSAGLPRLAESKSCARAADLDGDGDLDLFVGGRVVANHYGQTPDSYLLINNGKGVFSIETDQRAPGLRQAGMVTDAVWADFNNDRQPDLVVVGDWMTPRVFINQKGRLSEVDKAFGDVQMSGFWQCLTAADFDKDGDTDLMAGNLGLNTKFRKGPDGRLRMWVKDLDGNQTTDQIIAYNRPGNTDDWFPVATKDELGKQMPSIINKRYVAYSSIAGKPISDIFKAADLTDAQERSVDQFASVYLENTTAKGESPTFQVHQLPLLAQVSKVYALTPFDADGDGDLDVLGGGNFYGVGTYQGRYDASNGFVLVNNKGQFTAQSSFATGFVLNGEIRSIVPVQGKNGQFVLAGRNGQRVQTFRVGR